MKILSNKFLFLTAAALFVLSFQVALAQPVKPEIQIDIGGFNKGSFEGGWQEGQACPAGVTAGEGKCIEISWISQYVGALYRYGVGIAGVLAVIMMMAGGFFWLMSGGSPDKVGKAKDFITSALSGLFLALFSFIILYTINPRLVAMEPITVSEIAKQEYVCCMSPEGKVSSQSTPNGNCAELGEGWKNASGKCSCCVCEPWSSSGVSFPTKYIEETDKERCEAMTQSAGGMGGASGQNCRFDSSRSCDELK